MAEVARVRVNADALLDEDLNLLPSTLDEVMSGLSVTAWLPVELLRSGEHALTFTGSREVLTVLCARVETDGEFLADLVASIED